MKRFGFIGIICLIALNLAVSLAYVNAADDKTLKDAENYYNQGLSYWFAQDYEKALEYYCKAIDLDPDNAYYYYCAATALNGLEIYDVALSFLNKAIELEPRYLIEAYHLKGEVLVSMGRYNLAIPYFDKAVLSGYKASDPYLNKGEALYYLHGYDEALLNVDKAIALHPDYYQCYDLKGYCMLKMEKYDAAVECFDKMLEKYPSYIDALAGKAVALYNLGKYEKALESSEKALAGTSERADVFYTRSLIYAKLNDTANCISNLKKATGLFIGYREEARLDKRFYDIGRSKEFFELLGCFLKFDGKDIMFSVQPLFSGQTLMVPLDELKSCFGYTVATEVNTNSVVIRKDKKTIKLQTANQYASVDNKKVDMKVKPVVVDKSWFVPADFIATCFGATARWDEATKTLYLNTAEYSLKNMDLQREWALGTTAIIAKANGWRLNAIGGGTPSAEHVAEVKGLLKDSWDVYDRTSALSTINWLKNEGHRKSYNEDLKKVLSLPAEENDRILKQYENRQEEIERYLFLKNHGEEIGDKSLIAWDYGRLVLVAGTSYICGYITYDEAWKEIMDAARIIQKTYISWEDMAKNYMYGGEYWTGDAYYSRGRMDAYYWLLENENSPWKKIKWELPLG